MSDTTPLNRGASHHERRWAGTETGSCAQTYFPADLALACRTTTHSSTNGKVGRMAGMKVRPIFSSTKSGDGGGDEGIRTLETVSRLHP